MTITLTPLSHWPFRLWREHPRSVSIALIGGAVVIFAIVFAVVLAGLLATHDPLKISADRLKSPSLKHFMGTDRLGRDVFSRVLHGGRVSLTASGLAMTISLPIALLLGLLSGYTGGNFDRVLRTIMDALYGFPPFLMTLAFIFVLGPGLVNVALSASIAWIPTYFRFSRSLCIKARENLYVEAAMVMGAKRLYIVARHILPHVIPQVIVFSTVVYARILITVSSLCFLGVGIPAPTPEWGSDLALGLLVMSTGAWWQIFFPGTMLFTTALSLNMIGESLTTIMSARKIT
jgi:peptide/nickel transport system permease protein